VHRHVGFSSMTWASSSSSLCFCRVSLAASLVALARVANFSLHLVPERWLRDGEFALQTERVAARSFLDPARGPGARESHEDKGDREDRGDDGVGLEPAIERDSISARRPPIKARHAESLESLYILRNIREPLVMRTPVESRRDADAGAVRVSQSVRLSRVSLRRSEAVFSRGHEEPRPCRDLRKTSASRRNVSRLTLARRCVLYGRDGDSRKQQKFPSLENFCFAARGNGVASATSTGGDVNGEIDRARFASIVVPHLSEAFALACWLTGSRADAEDVVQDASLRAFRAIASFNGTNARAWVLTIVRNTAYSWLEKNRALQFVSVQDLGESAEALRNGGWAAALADTPETVLIAKADAGRVEAAVAALPPEFREVLLLRDIQGLEYREIAEVTAVPVGTVMSRLARARRRMIDAIRTDNS
jgi:RNA polymerase sigma factor (sigma-70 family)